MTAAFESLKDAYSVAEDQFERHWSDCLAVAQSIRGDIASILGLEPFKVKFVRRSDIEENRRTDSDEVPKQFNNASEAASLATLEQFQVGICFGVPYRNEPDPAWYLLLPIKVTKRDDSLVVFSEALPIEFPVGVPPKLETRRFSGAVVNRLIEQRKASYEKFLSGSGGREVGFHTFLPRKME